MSSASSHAGFWSVLAGRAVSDRAAAWDTEATALLGVRAFTAILLLGIAAVLLARHRSHIAARIEAGLCVGVVCYLGAQAFLTGPVDDWMALPLVAGAVAVPSLIWWLAMATFRDRFVLAKRHVLTALVAVVVGCVAAFDGLFVFGETPVLRLVDSLAHQATSLVLLVLAIIESQRGARDDLVEPRRQLRKWLVVVVAIYAALVSIVEVSVRTGPAPVAIEMAHAGGLFLLVSLYGWATVRSGDVLFAPDALPGVELSLPRSPPGPPHEPLAPSQEPAKPSEDDARRSEPTSVSAPSSARDSERPSASSGSTLEPQVGDSLAVDAELLARLREWVAAKGFLEADLTVGRLAKQLGTQEYKLRRLLNSGLGFRNFSDFLHRHRIHEACAQLTGPGAMDVSILNLSLELGYGSLATFNRAFRSVTGVSPTEYRQGHHQRPEPPPGGAKD